MLMLLSLLFSAVPVRAQCCTAAIFNVCGEEVACICYGRGGGRSDTLAMTCLPLHSLGPLFLWQGERLFGAMSARRYQTQLVLRSRVLSFRLPMRTIRFLT